MQYAHKENNMAKKLPVPEDYDIAVALTPLRQAAMSAWEKSWVKEGATEDQITVAKIYRRDAKSLDKVVNYLSQFINK